MPLGSRQEFAESVAERCPSGQHGLAGVRRGSPAPAPASPAWST
jgi:hypothetical protein